MKLCPTCHRPLNRGGAVNGATRCLICRTEELMRRTGWRYPASTQYQRKQREAKGNQ